MADKKTIAVMGATGAQGGGLVRAILADPRAAFAVRALTRDANSDKARALAELGAEVVAADVDDVESLKRAFDGAYGAYCVTFFWEHFSPEKEAAHVRNMADGGQGSRPEARDLVHAGGHPPLGAARRRSDADPDGQVQGAALRRQGRGRPGLHRARRPDDLPADLVLLGQPDPLRHGPQAGSRRHARPSPCPWASKSCRASPPRTSVAAPTASSSAATSSSARPSASPAST